MSPKLLPFDATPADLTSHVDDLVAQLSDDEALSLLHSRQMPIERLGLGEFRTGGEAVHGVAWLGQATVFPQPPGLAAMWDEELLRRVGEATGREVRAKHRAGLIDLNCWAPVVNPLRNPLWGRNEEGYSEDPWVTTDCAVAFSRGLRGDHPTYWRTLPTLKHLLGYNNETDRCTSSSDLSPRDLHEYELPAFLQPLSAGAIAGVMPAYNLVNGRPVHVAAELFDACREVAPETIIVSDAYAAMNLHQAERYSPDMASGHADAVRAGLDSFTELEDDPTQTVAALREAVERGLLGMDEVRRAARRLLLARARTGEFTVDGGPFVDDACLDTPEHAALALEAAAAQVTLLTNRGVLPLTAPQDRSGRLTVVGPMAETVLLDWYAGTPSSPVSIAEAARGLTNWQVTSDDGADHVQLLTPEGMRLTTAADGTVVATPDAATTFEVTRWHDDVVTIRDPETAKLLTGRDWFGVRAASDRPHGWVCHEAFNWVSDGANHVRLRHRGTRMWLRVEPFSGVVSVTADAPERATRFAVETISRGTDRVRALCAGADIALVTLGNEPHLHGRETEDRTTLELPEHQTALADEALAATPQTVVALVSSYPFVVADLAARADALLWTSHAGQALGPALIDVLTGVREPRGRLAQTWWASDADLADVLDYRLLASRQTCWYSAATPLFGLGHGLTYGQVEYRSLELTGAPADDNVVAQVEVHNSGDRVAHELVQIYADGGPDWGVRLVGWQRVVLEPGDSHLVEVAVPAARLRQWSPRDNAWRWPANGWTIAAGSSQHDRHHPVTLTSPSLVHTRRDYPLEAWLADAREGLVGVPRSQLRGTALAARREGRVEFHDLHAADSLVLVARNPGRTEGLIRLSIGGGAEHQVAVPPSAEWTELPVPLAIAPGDDLIVQLVDVELDQITRPGEAG